MHAYAQDVFNTLFDEKHDSIYYSKLQDKLTARFFLSRKYSDFELVDNYTQQYLEYKSNSRFSLGIGTSYKWLSLNLGIGLENPNDSVYGKTRRIDLQTQINLRKLTLNFYTGKYKGYYLLQPYSKLQNWEQNKQYIRPDIANQTYGLSGYYVFKSERYSNRASFLQNEWQKQTAGSFIAGASMLYNRISADSSLVPHNFVVDTVFNSVNFNKTAYFAMGGNIGYAITFVLWQHWFLDLAVTGGFTTGSAKVFDNGDKQKVLKLGFNVLSKMGIGFNSENFYAGLNTSVMRSSTPLPINESELEFNVGVVRFVFAYRFNYKPEHSIIKSWFN